MKKKKLLLYFSYLIILSGILLGPKIAGASCLCSCQDKVKNSTCFFSQKDTVDICKTTCAENNLEYLNCDDGKPTDTGFYCTPPGSSESAASTNSSNSSDTASFDNPVPFFSKKSLAEVVGLIIKGILGLMGVAALVIFIYAGILWMFAKGNSTQIKKSIDVMKYCVIGMAVIYLSYAMLKFVFGIIE
jgi:hypothetical protein